MQTRIVEEAEFELAAAIARYEDLEKGLGIRLKEEVRAALAWIETHPDLPRLRPAGYRRVNLKVFRHFIAYTVHHETLWILAIAHGHRRPEFWTGRKSQVY